MTKSAEHSTALAILVAAGVGVQVGAATVASRFALMETEPFALGAMRYAIGFLLLGESLTVSFIAGLCLVAGGLWVALGAS